MSTTWVHNGAIGAANKMVRQSVSLPANVGGQVRRLVKKRKLNFEPDVGRA